MRDKPERHTDAADRTVEDIRRKTRKRYSSEEWNKRFGDWLQRQEKMNAVLPHLFGHLSYRGQDIL